jgi:hypothetical protein
VIGAVPLFGMKFFDLARGDVSHRLTAHFLVSRDHLRRSFEPLSTLARSSGRSRARLTAFGGYILLLNDSVLNEPN